jgi:hypothetical protein
MISYFIVRHVVGVENVGVETVESQRAFHSAYTSVFICIVVCVRIMDMSVFYVFKCKCVFYCSKTYYVFMFWRMETMVFVVA